MPVTDHTYINVHAKVPFTKMRPTQLTAHHQSDAGSVLAECHAAFAMHKNCHTMTNEAAVQSDEPAAQYKFALHGQAGE